MAVSARGASTAQLVGERLQIALDNGRPTRIVAVKWEGHGVENGVLTPEMEGCGGAHVREERSHHRGSLRVDGWLAALASLST